MLIGGLFVRAERRAAAPMLLFAFFADPGRRAALAAMLLMGGVPAGYLCFISLPDRRDLLRDHAGITRQTLAAA